MGIVTGNRPLNLFDSFEMAAERTLGDRVRADTMVAARLWGATARVTWRRAQFGDVAKYSDNDAAKLVAAIRREPREPWPYWIYAYEPGDIHPDIAAALATEGWEGTPTDDDEEEDF